MGTSIDPAAVLHPGAVRAVFDHLILALTADGRPGPPVFLFSHYRVRWADDGTAGELAFVELERDGRGVDRIVLTDEPALAASQASRLCPAAWAARDLEKPAIAARFESSRLVGPSVHETVTADGLVIGVEWTDLAPPRFATGPAPRVPGEDIASVLFEARAAGATVNGRAVAGAVFLNEGWLPWLGRPLRSGVVALAEVLVARP